MNKRAWCFDCAGQVPYRVTVKQDIMQYGENRLPYKRHTAQCVNCGRELFVDWVDDLNAQEQKEAVEHDRRYGAKDH